MKGMKRVHCMRLYSAFAISLILSEFLDSGPDMTGSGHILSLVASDRRQLMVSAVLRYSALTASVKSRDPRTFYDTRRSFADSREKAWSDEVTWVSGSGCSRL
jgi:hypothetical protein